MHKFDTEKIPHVTLATFEECKGTDHLEKFFQDKFSIREVKALSFVILMYHMNRGDPEVI